MALRTLLLVVGLLELAAPRKMVDFWMARATDEDVELKPWVYTVARVEGLILVLWVLASGRGGSGEASDE